MSKQQALRVSIIGAGYVGCVTAACLAHLGHQITAIDSDPHKVKELASGRSPVLEPGLSELVASEVAAGRLRAVLAGEASFAEEDIAILCVSTPSLASGAIDVRPAQRVFAALARDLTKRSSPLVVVVRMTILPGKLRQIVDGLPAEARKNLRLVVNPEFLRETTAIKDFEKPPFVILGGDDPAALAIAEKLYTALSVPIHKVSWETAMLVKYAANAFHGLKVSFANEIGQLAEHCGADPLAVMKLFCEDRVLNLSPVYLRPGFAFGGSCLPKDLRALLALARQATQPVPVLKAILDSNQERIANAADRIAQSGLSRFAMLGVSFKRGTDDLRESPYLFLARDLVARGLNIRIYDPDVESGKLVGGNLQFVAQYLPSFPAMLCTSADEAMQDAEGVILCKNILAPEALGHLRERVREVFDLEYLGIRAGAEFPSMYGPRSSKD
jgi:GDP-mannose 6-dehydrogenase